MLNRRPGLFRRISIIACLSTTLTLADVEVRAPFDGEVRHPRVSSADYLHLAAELSFDWEKEEVTGRVEHRFRALESGLATIVLDSVDIAIKSVRDGSGQGLVFRSHDDRLEIDLRAPLDVGQESTLTIDYSCRPKKGVYFISPIAEHPDRPKQVWTQGETENTRCYIPCFDSPAERLTSELKLRIPAELDVLSNGRRLGSEAHDDGTKTVHWKIDEEHVPYLICFAAGKYEKLRDTWDGIPMQFWHYPGDAERAKVSFRGTADMMAFFSGLFGRYPWNKYDQIVVRDFVAGGMENTTATILTDGTLHHEKDEPHVSSRGLVAHEIAHQWFGDLVTCRDWSELWLNESFATFCANLYTEHLLGRDEAQMERRSHASSYMNEDKGRYRRPIRCRTYQSPSNMFDRHSYPKGARVLEMLRQVMGDDAFFRGLRSFLDRHQFQSVDTYQLRRALEDSSGQSLGWFFEQWIHHGGHPEIGVTQSYDPGTRRVTLRVQQTQKVDQLTPLFRLPVEIGLHLSGGEVIVEKIEVTKVDQAFTFDSSGRPSFVTFDHRRVLLANISHEKPRSDWLAQLSRGVDPLIRIEAAAALGGLLDSSDDETVRDRLIERLDVESFWGVRQAIVRALANSRSEACTAALAEALSGKRHPRVRETAAQVLGSIGRAEGLDALRTAAAEDTSDWVRSAALRSAARIDLESAVPIARAALDRDSHRERLRRAAIDILVRAKDLDSLDKILALAKPGSHRSIRGTALRALPVLAPDDARVFEAVAEQLGAPLVSMRRAVVDTIGQLGGKEARRLLEERRKVEEDKSIVSAIDRAIERIGKPTRLDDLQKEIEALRRRSEALEKKLDELGESKGVDL